MDYEGFAKGRQESTLSKATGDAFEVVKELEDQMNAAWENAEEFARDTTANQGRYNAAIALGSARRDEPEIPATLRNIKVVWRAKKEWSRTDTLENAASCLVACITKLSTLPGEEADKVRTELLAVHGKLKQIKFPPMYTRRSRGGPRRA
jgi:hypothetical protein